MNEEKKYFAFISYSHKDKKVAKKLQNFIQGYKIPAKLEDRPDLPKRIGRVFRDEDELVGDELTPQIEEALKQSRYLIVVCSPNSAKSKYVNEEIEYFKSLGGETKILPYIIAGKATTDEDPDCCYAPALRENQKKHQIVGGDAQENGAEAASVKLIAGMLRLEFNTLYDRFRKAEKRKRKIVITAITAFALLMAGVTAWILFLYNDVKESKSIILAENAMNKIEKGDYLGARRNALEAITLSYSPKAERALRQSWESNSGILEGHSNYVNSVSWSPDGKYLASGSADNTVKIWDANNGECIRTLKGHLSSVMSVSWSPDGRYLASGSVDKSIVIWDANSGEKLKTFEGHSAYISSICWSPDGRYLASGAKDQIEDEYIEELFIWDANSGEIIKNFEGHSWGVFSVSWSPDGKYLASSSGGWNDEGQIGEVFIWDVNSGACLKTLEGHSSYVWSVSFSPDGKYLASGSSDNTVIIWDVKSGEKFKTLEGDFESIYFVNWSLDSKYLASCSDDGNIIIWDVNNEEKFKTLELHSANIRFVCFSPDGKYLASNADLENVKLWDLNEDKKFSILDSIPANTYSSDISPNGKYRVLNLDNGDIVIEDVKSGERLKTLEKHSSGVVNFCWNPNEKYFIISGIDNRDISLWDAKSGLWLQNLKGNYWYVANISFTSDGRKIISEDEHGGILQWDFPPLDELIEKTKKWAGK